MLFVHEQRPASRLRLPAADVDVEGFDGLPSAAKNPLGLFRNVIASEKVDCDGEQR
jgi:hypothetical protein